jgi:L-iditol 2-dehydrogenase
MATDAERGTVEEKPKPIEAARLHGAGDLRIVREPASEPGPGEVRVRVAAVGLCGSDLHWFEEGSIGEATLDHPLVLGHEFSGRLDDGRLVAADPAIPCGSCPACRAGREHLCERSRFAGHSVTDGALRSAMWWPEHLLRVIPPSISAEEGALLEPLGVALHAVDLAAIRPGESAAVLGCGPIGLLIVQVLRDATVAPIVVAEPLAHRLAAALEMGGTETSSPGEAGDVDVVFDAAGTDEAVAAAIVLARPGGRVVLVGIPPGDRTTYRASIARRKELTMQHARRMRAEDLDRAIALAAAGRVDLARLVSHRFQLEEARKAFATLEARAGIKVIVTP